MLTDHLETAGVEIRWLADDDTDGLADSVFTYDPSFVIPAGAIILRPGKQARRAEAELHRAFYEGLMPILGTIDQLKRGLLGDSATGAAADFALVLDALWVVIPLGVGIVIGVVGVSNLLPATIDAGDYTVSGNLPDYIAASHTFTVQSLLALTTFLPSRLNATLCTESLCPLRVKSSLPIAASHTFIVWSTLPVTIRVPSRLNATLVTQPAWPSRQKTANRPSILFSTPQVKKERANGPSWRRWMPANHSL